MNKSIGFLTLATLALSAPAWADLPESMKDLCPEGEFGEKLTRIGHGQTAICAVAPAFYQTEGQALDSAQRTVDGKQRELCHGRDPYEIDNQIHVDRRLHLAVVLNISKCR